MTKASQIPIDLVENVAQGRCVLFLGADAALGEGSPPTRAQLAAALATKYEWVAPGQTWRFATEEYLSREPPDRHGLITFVREQLARYTRPSALHQLAVDLGFDAIVTNAYDDLMESAMREAGRRVLQVVGDAEIAYTGGKEEVILIRLAGSANRPDSLVLTDDDQLDVEINLAERLQAVRGWCMLRPLLFVGWNPEDDSLRRLYKAATRKLGQHKRRNYIVWAEPTSRAVARWKRYNVEIIPTDPLVFLRELQRRARQQRAVQPGYRPGDVVHKLPYKFLNYFDPEDRDIFCGREVEAPLVYRLALSYPLLTLFGQSGVGKTSLLRAGVMPLLANEGYTYAYVRALGDPLQAIREGVLRAFSDSLPPPTGEGRGGGQTLHDFFTQTLDAEACLIIILDQFEELFIRSSRATRKRFWRELGACLGLMTPEVRFILCLREDFLAELDEARRALGQNEAAPVPYILRNSYRLTPLEQDTARLAIVEPASRACCQIEPQLVEVLLGHVETQNLASHPQTWSLVQADGAVPAPSLQIVMDRLYRQALYDAGHAPPPERGARSSWTPPALTLTLALYRDLGGAGRILGDYVTGALDLVAERGGNRALAVTVLKVLVTGQKTKAALSDAELLAGVAEADPDFAPDDVDDVVCLRATRAALVDLRLVRSFNVGVQVLYELAHDHMAAEIATWIDEAEMQVKLARELLRRELDNWQGAGLLIRPEVFALIHERREELRHLNAEELELLFRSALAAGYEVVYWFRRAQEAGVAVDALAQEGLHSDTYRTRAAAVTALGQVGEPFVEAIIEMLADDYPQVRVAAIHALEALRPDGAWREHLKYECYVPAGPFIMGDDKGEYDDEKPAHEVTLDAYYIGKYPVTNAEYQRYMDDIGRAFTVPQGKADHPVVEVTWYDARDYAAWAGMRLLTEAEWEKAASWEMGGQGDKGVGRQGDRETRGQGDREALLGSWWGRSRVVARKERSGYIRGGMNLMPRSAM